ncbi:LysR family transcriptional regulator [Curvibacter sp. CHRR-16]|nr:LysR family transcriptional regulator [Curvibacter sp. CHRR-16]
MPEKTLHLRSFDLNLLKVFDAIMAERNITRAAEQLALTQPAVSNALRRLRDALGDELLVRNGRHLEATPRAEGLWLAVRETLQQLENQLGPGNFTAQAAQDIFTLTMADATAAEILPRLMQILAQEASGVAVRTVPLTTRDPRKALEAGEADLAIGHFPAVVADLTAHTHAGSAHAFSHMRLFVGNYVCVMRKDHPLAVGPLGLDDFCNARHLLVSFSGRAFGFIDEALRHHKRSRRVVLTVNQFFTAGRVVTQTDMLTVLPRHFVNVTGFADQLVVRDLPIEVPPIQIDALWHLRLERSRPHQWLREQIARVATTAFNDPYCLLP